MDPVRWFHRERITTHAARTRPSAIAATIFAWTNRLQRHIQKHKINKEVATGILKRGSSFAALSFKRKAAQPRALTNSRPRQSSLGSPKVHCTFSPRSRPSATSAFFRRKIQKKLANLFRGGTPISRSVSFGNKGGRRLDGEQNFFPQNLKVRTCLFFKGRLPARAQTPHKVDGGYLNCAPASSLNLVRELAYQGRIQGRGHFHRIPDGKRARPPHFQFDGFAHRKE